MGILSKLVDRSTSGGSIRRNSSSTSLSSHGCRRNDSAGSLISHGFRRNDSMGSLTSIEIPDSDDTHRRRLSTGILGSKDAFYDHKESFQRARIGASPPINGIVHRQDSEFSDNSWETGSNQQDNLGQSKSTSEEEDIDAEIGQLSSPDVVCESSASGDIEKDWIIPKTLAEALAGYPSSRTTLLTLYENHGFNTRSVRAVVACHKRIFTISGEMIDLRPQVSICNDHLSSGGCQHESSCERLHICPEYLADNCEDEECSLGHRLGTHHNVRVLTEFCLQSISSEPLRKIIHYALNFPRQEPLDICDDYNNTFCNKDKCRDLHICKYYIAHLTTYPYCSLNHNFLEPSVAKLLENQGLSTSESPKDIVKALIDSNPEIQKKLSFDDNNCPLLPETLWSTYTYGNVEIPEICHSSVNGICINERTGCSRLHCKQYSHWQVRELKGPWLNLTSSQIICLELAFCDPEKDGVVVPPPCEEEMSPNTFELETLFGHHQWQANFGTNKNELTLSSGEKLLELRRLHSEDIKEFVPGREFQWYYQSRNGKYIEFGTNTLSGEEGDDEEEEEDMQMITSRLLENAFEDLTDEGSKIHLTSATFTYHLDVKTMTLTNEIEHTTRSVRRRPKPHFMKL